MTELAAVATVRQMVNPGGCAWHAEQTHESLLPYLVEETAEFVETVESDRPAAERVEELADLLYQVLFHCAIAERDGEGYDFAAVAERLDTKLRARHPHVFGDRGYMTSAELEAEWENLKAAASGQKPGSRGVFEGIPTAMPTLARASKMVDRVRSAKLLTQLPASDTSKRVVDLVAKTEGGVGEVLLETVMVARAAGVDPDRELRQQLRQLESSAAKTNMAK
ncbi:MazG nucleotide pyrophosphohydrolase domain-containing protein [Leucobacter sp. OH1287]|uniref:MazG nucleotide pyrophosphohydrolase domain-containing protein n=1 Tax=Leucobacter sp. OH1287 TaxID=2491049 RepID=UPI000F5E7FA9|nr:MazG nucleotide pyrophosphohydrolase domain-containing protein [Leucobacter sp. OH1287]RRD60521.1 nucleoside triphosphate hydrolase [Leucobacter sp. OH1287]